ncbi:MAG: amidohydrolase family protein [Isosphaeraceae bacterium]
MKNETTTNRRRFLALSAAALASARGASFARPARAAAKGGPYVDVHTHLGRTWNGDAPMTAEALVRWMDEHNVAKAVVLPLVSPESSSYLNLTEQALDGAKKFPDRLVPFCCIDPRTSYTGGRAGLRKMLQEYVDKGAKGFGEHKVGLPIDDPKMMQVYEVCDDLKLPVLFHSDNIRGTDAPGLPGLERVLKAFPQLNFIGHGPGFWASIAGNLPAKDLGGYPKGKVPPGGALDRLFDRYKNLWGDLSAGSGSNAIGRDHEFGQAFLIRRSERLMFGTDYLKPGQEVPQFDLLASFDLPADVRARIERGNAVKLLGLSPV